MPLPTIRLPRADAADYLGVGPAATGASMLPGHTLPEDPTQAEPVLSIADYLVEEWAKKNGHISKDAKAIIDSVAAVSVGVVDGNPVTDLEYVEDVRAETDMNVVITGRGLFVEVQGTAEGAPFSKAELDQLLDLATKAGAELTQIQKQALAG